MRYIDSGGRDPAHALYAWLQNVLSPGDVSEVRWQAGYFTREPLGLFAPTLARLAANRGTVNVLVGSNDGGTQRDDVADLVRLIGLPRANALLGVVQYDNAFFHPKTYHFRRNDGSQCAYVGSANLTPAGVTALNVEAGIILDTRDSDPPAVLNEIAAAVDGWFSPTRAGLNPVTRAADLGQLVTDGVLALAPPPPPPRPATGSGGGGGGSPSRPHHRLRPLASLPSLPPPPAPPASTPVVGAVPPVAQPPAPVPVPAAPIPVATQNPPFPNYVLFAPGMTTPTVGANALSGRPLPAGMVGVIIRLSGDSTRLFAAQVGTANLSIPIGAVETLRFGLLGRSRYPNRPRAEYDLEVRYIGSSTFRLTPDPADSNVMLYGYLHGEGGHKDIRMLMPAVIRDLIPSIRGAGMPLPADDDFALLEWPTLADPSFWLTFIEPGHALAVQAQGLFTAATAAGQLLGDNGCGLPAGVSPPW
jgi:hypothetical protein